jgi:hypothetical protein
VASSGTMPAVSQPQTRERRRYERFPQFMEVHARCLQSGLPMSDPPREFDGRIQNLSNGGACILCSCSLQPQTLVFCNFPVGDPPVSVLTLLQVRWTAKRGQKPPNYLSGLQFVF